MRCFLILLVLLFACGNGKVNSNGLTVEETKSVVASNERTILYFWTSWCSASRSVLSRVYRPALDSIRASDLPYRILLVYASGVKPIDIPEFDSSEFSTLRHPGTGFPLDDRMEIRAFLIELLGKEKTNEILKGKYSFGVPVEIMLDKDLNVVIPDVPQHTELLLKALRGELGEGLSEEE